MVEALKLFVDLNRYNRVVRGIAKLRGLLFHENSTGARPMRNPIPSPLMEISAYTRLYDHFLRFYWRYTGKQPRVLDVGCGGEKRFYGLYGRYIADEYVGIDPDLKRNEVSDTTLFMSGIAEKVHCDSGYFDATLLLSVLDHVGSLRETFFEAWRVLKEGGHLWVVSSVFKGRADIDQSYMNAHKRYFSREGLRALLEPGFSDIHLFRGIGRTAYLLGVKKPAERNPYSDEAPGMVWEREGGW